MEAFAIYLLPFAVAIITYVIRYEIKETKINKKIRQLKTCQITSFNSKSSIWNKIDDIYGL